jgi:alkanesulfonate monooxygenase SsuD/methylene tetrahydromethanopterin reductase-like flavin-dependent oxidoreductase (luciferase family)
MHISAFMGPVAFGASNDLKKIEMCIDQALQCADAGFAMVTFGEQHFNGYEPYSNPFLMAARLSPNLGSTWFGTTIVPLPFHNPLRLAEESNIVDLLTRGRFVLGMSQGRTGPVPDWKNFGLDQADRDEIFATKLDFLQRAAVQKAGDPVLVLDTKWDRGELNGRIMPLSWRKGGAQLAIGTSTDSTIDDVARRGLPLFLSPVRLPIGAAKLQRHRDGMKAAGYSDLQRTHASRLSMTTTLCVVGATDAEAWQAAEALTGRNPMMDRSVDGRSLAELAAVDEDAIADGSDPFPRNANFAKSWLVVGSPESVAERIGAYEKAGFQHLNLRFTVGAAMPDLVNRSFSLFVERVLPLIDHELFPALRDDEIEQDHFAPSGMPGAFSGPGGGNFGMPGAPGGPPAGPGGGNFGMPGGPGDPSVRIPSRAPTSV